MGRAEKMDVERKEDGGLKMRKRMERRRGRGSRSDRCQDWIGLVFE